MKLRYAYIVALAIEFFITMNFLKEIRNAPTVNFNLKESLADILIYLVTIAFTLLSMRASYNLGIL